MNRNHQVSNCDVLYRSEVLSSDALDEVTRRRTVRNVAPVRIRSVLFLSLVFLPLVLLASCSLGSESVTLTGFVLTSKTDDNDNPAEIYLFDGKEEYPIAKNEKQEELLELVDQRIKVQGELTTGLVGGKRVLSVESYDRVEEDR